MAEKRARQEEERRADAERAAELARQREADECEKKLRKVADKVTKAVREPSLGHLQ